MKFSVSTKGAVHKFSSEQNSRIITSHVDHLNFLMLLGGTQAFMGKFGPLRKTVGVNKLNKLPWTKSNTNLSKLLFGEWMVLQK